MKEVDHFISNTDRAQELGLCTGIVCHFSTGCTRATQLIKEAPERRGGLVVLWPDPANTYVYWNFRLREAEDWKGIPPLQSVSLPLL